MLDYKIVNFGELEGYANTVFILNGDKQRIEIKLDEVSKEPLNFVKGSKFDEKTKAMIRKGF